MKVRATTVAYILSAGAGLRLGGLCKGLIQIDGVPLIARQLSVMISAGIDHIVVVTGYQSVLISEIVADQISNFQNRLHKAISVECLQTYGSDIQVSVASAIRHSHSLFIQRPDFTGAMISLVDLPLITVRDIVKITGTALQSRVDAVIPTSESGQPGHPIWLSRKFLLNIDCLTDKFSLKNALLRGESDSTSKIKRFVTDAPSYFSDLDTIEDAVRYATDYGLCVFVPRSESAVGTCIVE